MPPPTSTTIILISGAWHTDFHLQPALPALHKLGYQVTPISLPSAGVSTPPTLFADDIAKIQTAIQDVTDSSSNKICVIAHSAAGCATLIAISNFLALNIDRQSRLTHLCLLATYLDTARAAAAAAHWFGFDAATGYLTASRSAEVFYSDMSEEDSRPFVAALVPQTPVVPPGELPTLWRKCETLQRRYIVCLRDQSIPPAVQRMEAKECGMDIVELDTGHCPFVSQPALFAECVDGIVRGD